MNFELARRIAITIGALPIFILGFAWKAGWGGPERGAPRGEAD